MLNQLVWNTSSLSFTVHLILLTVSHRLPIDVQHDMFVLVVILDPLLDEADVLPGVQPGLPGEVLADQLVGVLRY